VRLYHQGMHSARGPVAALVMVAVLVSGCGGGGDGDDVAADDRRTVVRQPREQVSVSTCVDAVTEAVGVDVFHLEHGVYEGHQELTQRYDPAYVRIYFEATSVPEVHKLRSDIVTAEALGRPVDPDLVSPAALASSAVVHQRCYDLEGARQVWLPAFDSQTSDCQYVVLDALEKYMRDRSVDAGDGSRATEDLKAAYGADSTEFTAFEAVKNHPNVWAEAPYGNGLMAALTWVEYHCGEGPEPTDELVDPAASDLPPWVPRNLWNPHGKPTGAAPAPTWEPPTVPGDVQPYTGGFPTEAPTHLVTCEDHVIYFSPHLVATGNPDKILRAFYAGDMRGWLDAALTAAAEHPRLKTDLVAVAEEVCEPYQDSEGRGEASPAPTAPRSGSGGGGGWTPPGDVQDPPPPGQALPVEPYDGPVPDTLPRHLVTCEDVIVYFSPWLATHSVFDVQEQFGPMFPDMPEMVGSMRVAAGAHPDDIRNDPWSVAADACQNGPSA